MRGSSAASVQGTVWVSQTIVDVQWVWLALLFVFIVFSLVLFAIAVVYERRSMIWKSSSLAVLHGLHPELQISIGGAAKMADMLAQAKEMRASLGNGGEGWRLS